jgi:long-subunit acyl-CoA synthetase (AMP-forming)
VGTWTWKEYRANVDTLEGLLSAEVRVINILGFNSPEWFMANCGRSQRVVSPQVSMLRIFQMLQYISEHSKARLLSAKV